MKRTFLVLAALALAIAALSAPAAATDINETAPYYNNSSSDVSTNGWLPGENATLDNMGDMLVRLGPYLIGTGDMDPSDTGFQGLLLTGLVMAGALLGAIATLPVGAAGGSVLAVVVGYGMTSLGFAPSWFRTMLLFGVGLIAFVAFASILDGR